MSIVFYDDEVRKFLRHNQFLDKKDIAPVFDAYHDLQLLDNLDDLDVLLNNNHTNHFWLAYALYHFETSLINRQLNLLMQKNVQSDKILELLVVWIKEELKTIKDKVAQYCPSGFTLAETRAIHRWVIYNRLNCSPFKYNNEISFKFLLEDIAAKKASGLNLVEAIDYSILRAWKTINPKKKAKQHSPVNKNVSVKHSLFN